MTVIKFENVWKKFRRGEKVNSIREALPFFFRNVIQNGSSGLRTNEFWALQNVNFEVRKGDILGIIGPNGAGKSTILKLLSNIMAPNKGKSQIKGRLTALIEVTAGFHQDLTGRENIYLNGAILGMTRREIDKKLDRIVDFSGLKEFIDTPIKRYSSGMSARLGFSVAAHMDPEILLVDEVLSVGDMDFQAKSSQKMREMLNSGATIIFISHNLPLVQSLCKRVILLHKGQIVKEGKADEIIPYYENIVYRQQEDVLKQELVLRDMKAKTNSGTPIEILDLLICDENYNQKENFTINEFISLKVCVDTKEPIENPIFYLDIVRADGILCCSGSTKNNRQFLPKINGKIKIDVELGRMNLTPGIYIVKLSIWDKDMIHPYVVRHKDIFRIEATEINGDMNAVFLPNIKWVLDK